MTKLMKTTLIDSHLHMWSAAGIETILRIRDDCGLDAYAFMSLSQYGLPHMAQNVDGFLLKAMDPDRAFIFGGLHYDLPGVAPNEIDPAEQARRLIDIGCDGIKMLEGKPGDRKRLGIPLDAPMYDEYYAFLQAEKVPVVFHVADPEEFWDLDAMPAFAREHGWFYDETFPTKEQLYAETEGVLKKFPQLNVILAHFFFMSADAERAAAFLDRYPNANFDITPGSEMYFNFSKRPDVWRKLFTKYQDRILFGTDNTDEEAGPAPGDLSSPAGRVETMRRFLETGESFEGFDGKLRGIGLDASALEKLYYKNFQRLAGDKPRPLNFDLAIERCRWTIDQANRSSEKEKLLPALQNSLERLESIRSAE